jgi:hypothetical protein
MAERRPKHQAHKSESPIARPKEQPAKAAKAKSSNNAESKAKAKPDSKADARPRAEAKEVEGGGDIDDIFEKLKNKPKASKPVPVARHDAANDEFFDARGKNSKRKQTEEGYRVFSEDELKLGQSKDTPLCPFDCNCCY